MIAGDGCLMEGISHEAIVARRPSAALERSSCCGTTTAISIDGADRARRLRRSGARFARPGWRTERIDGHDTDAIAAAIERAHESDRPSLIACRTTIAFGAPTKAGTAAAHGAPLGAAEIAGARARLGWTSPPFVLPEDMIVAWREAGARGAAVRRAWEARLRCADRATQRPNSCAACDGDLPAGWRAADRRDQATKFAGRSAEDRDAAGLGHGARRAGAGGAGTGRRLGRPHRLQQHQGQGARRRSRARRFLRQLYPLRRARARAWRRR